MTVLGMTNTRMKDFFDLWVLLRNAALDDAAHHETWSLLARTDLQAGRLSTLLLNCLLHVEAAR